MNRIAIFFLLCASCGKTPAPTPRPEAYPRINLYPEEYSGVEVLGRTLYVNSSAEFIAGDKPGWFDVRYPAYGVTVNATLIPASDSDIASILDNRTERMARNLGGASAELTQGRGITIVTSPSALRTPVQLLATDSLTWVLAAVAVTDWSVATPPDSVAPILSAIRTDFLHMLSAKK